jgi:hypothetical protein
MQEVCFRRWAMYAISLPIKEKEKLDARWAKYELYLGKKHNHRLKHNFVNAMLKSSAEDLSIFQYNLAEVWDEKLNKGAVMKALPIPAASAGSLDQVAVGTVGGSSGGSGGSSPADKNDPLNATNATASTVAPFDKTAEQKQPFLDAIEFRHSARDCSMHSGPQRVIEYQATDLNHMLQCDPKIILMMHMIREAVCFDDQDELKRRRQILAGATVDDASELKLTQEKYVYYYG